MPKRLRYPLFLLGLATILVGGVLANSRGVPPALLGALVIAGFAFLVLSVAIR